MAFTFINYTDVTPGVYNAWTDVDVSAYVPATAKMVMLYVKTTHPSIGEAFGVRMKGSTDNRTRNIIAGGTSFHNNAYIGIDTNRVFQAYITNDGILYQSIWLLGYATDEDVVMFENAKDMTLSSTGAYETMNVASYVNSGDECIGAIFEVMVDSAAQDLFDFTIRAYGSTDDFYYGTAMHQAFGFMSKVTDGLCEGKREHADIKFYLVGYIKAGMLFYENALSITITSDITWRDSSLPNSNIGGLFEVVGLNVGWTKIGLRKNGYTGSDIVSCNNSNHYQLAIDSDANKIFEYNATPAGGGYGTVYLYLRAEFGKYSNKKGIYINIDDTWETILEESGLNDLAGILSVTRGGTSKDSWTQYGIVYASATDILSQITNINNGIFSTTAGGIPQCSTTLPSSLTIPGYVKADGTTPLTANWDVGSFDLTMQKLTVDGTTGILMTGVGSSIVFSNIANQGLHWYAGDNYWWLKGWNSGSVYGLVTHCPNVANRFVALGTANSSGVIQVWSVYVDGTAGNVGINTTTPDRTLDALHVSNPQLRLTQADNSKYVELKADSNSYLNILCGATEALQIRPNAIYAPNASGIGIYEDGGKGIFIADSTGTVTIANIFVLGTAWDSIAKMDMSYSATDVAIDGVACKITNTTNSNATLHSASMFGGMYSIIANGVTDSGSKTAMYFVNFRNNANDYGTLSTMRGVYLLYGHYTDSNAGIITTAVFGIRLTPYKSVGTIDTHYGLYMGAPSGAGTVTTNYGIYQDVDSTCRNVLTGRITQQRSAGATAPTTLDNAGVYLRMGLSEYTPNSYRAIGFGYTTNSLNYQPAYVAYKETSTVGYTKGQLQFFTRNVTTDTQPVLALTITETGGLDHDGNVVGFYGVAPVARAGAPTSALTTLTCTAPGTPDYAIADPINTNAYGFTTADEFLSVIKVIANNQIILGQIVTALRNLGLIT